MRVRSTQVGGEVVEVDDTTAVHGHDLDDRAGLLGHQLPGNDVGVVFERGEQDFVAGLQAGARIRLRDQVDRFRGATREDDLARRSRVHEVAHALARLFEQPGGFLAQLVNTAMHVGVVARFIGIDRIDHALRTLRRGSAVEEHQRFAMHFARENGKIAPHPLCVVGARRGAGRNGTHVRSPNRPVSADTACKRPETRVSISRRKAGGSMREIASSTNAHCNSACASTRSMPRDSR